MVLILTDCVCLLMALWIAPLVYLYARGGQAFPFSYLFNPWWQSTLLMQLYLFYLADLYDTEQEQSGVFLLARTAVAVGVMVLIMVTLYFFTPLFRHSRGAILCYAPAAWGTVVLGRLLQRRIHPKAKQLRNVMVICNGEPASGDVELVRVVQNGAYRLKGVALLNSHPAEPSFGVPTWRMMNPSDLPRLVRDHAIKDLVVARGCEAHPELVRELVRLSYAGVALSKPIEFFEQATGKVACEYLTHGFILSSHFGRPKFVYSKLKRIADLTVALTAGIVALPFCLIAALAIKLTSRGPVLFKQERLGLDGNPYILLKLRTMVDGAEKETGPKWAAAHDPRVTKVGRFLRKTRIDELPQIINVFKGEMSLIGPRPERGVFVEQFERDIPYYRERLVVRPGITGWAQVKQGYAAGTNETREKLGYDLFYLKNQSLMLDLMIVFMTVKKMLRGAGR